MFPAYAVAIAFTVFVASYLLLPNEVIEISKAAFTSSAIVSNIFYYLSSDYFDATLSNLALLHTWSLSVEWQFYLVFPLLFFSQHFKKYIIRYLIAFTVISIFITSYWVTVDKSAAFYLTHFRVYEFAIGGLLACVSSSMLSRIDETISSKWKEFVGSVSLLLLIAICFVYDKSTVFPGYTAALVNVLTAIVVLVGMSSYKPLIFRSFLNTRPMVYFGQLSYSLYLFHWPIIVFSDMYFLGEKSLSFYFVVIISTLLLSHLTFKIVENRFRKNTKQNTRATITIAVSSGIVCFSFFLATKFTNGFDFKYTTEQLEVINYERWGAFPGECSATHAKDEYYLCQLGELEKAPTVIILGDSHAQTLVWELDHILKRDSLSAIFITKGGCPPLLEGVPATTNISKSNCLIAQNKIREIIESTPSLRHALFATRWSIYKDAEFDASPNYQTREFSVRFKDTLRYVSDHGIEITLVQSIPEPGYPVPEYLIRSAKLGKQIEPFTFDSASQLKIAKYSEYLTKVIEPQKIFCNIELVCETTAHSVPLYFDSNHLTKTGASMLLKDLTFRTLQ